MITVGIVGGSGYTGGELLRLLSLHPGAEAVCITSRKLEGKPVGEVHPHLRGISSLKFESPSASEVAERCDVVFTAVPHGTAMDWVPELLDAGAKVVDLSADYRLPLEVFEKTYGMKHRAFREAVFGMTELHPEVRGAGFVSNPGCYPTGASLSVAPLVRAGLAERVVFDSKSGISGAGIGPSETSHYPNLAENVIAYKLTTHRHRAEIDQELGRLSPGIKVSFTPHVVPAIRGILTTAHLLVKEEFIGDIPNKGEISKIYQDFYRDSPFVRLVPAVPSLGAVRGSNFCDIGFEVDGSGDRIVVVSAIDNLVKGASGQAIQNMNLMTGMAETEGLWLPGGAP
ncbi:MAG TPA: N-acetyl-gamma-glutamyl-phosphate reductase [Methanothrix sp.]|jgi:N-acetyl-gamma-glutamyl-phosphate reductase|nr:N-acetyl-gamma-glutamyl-phosphate reductase [Methanothrix sp.]OPX78349.1 MAG: Malonyl CoA reductase (NADP) [Methanosaeta sp. PtaB.Bin087]HOI68609.1 N-acetyl-gamma-glutamyl-phosphate reductase [Methanothrix sp.]HPY71593.1 N-acetyl-gamma-glutamyl-phosphate reductase [Methanothrix sp.]HQA61594.1 N-acetyl-gamma-glutamyl-phosphate reductase [Methanothrix sp.]